MDQPPEGHKPVFLPRRVADNDNSSSSMLRLNLEPRSPSMATRTEPVAPDAPENANQPQAPISRQEATFLRHSAPLPTDRDRQRDASTLFPRSSAVQHSQSAPLAPTPAATPRPGPFSQIAQSSASLSPRPSSARSIQPITDPSLRAEGVARPKPDKAATEAGSITPAPPSIWGEIAHKSGRAPSAIGDLSAISPLLPAFSPQHGPDAPVASDTPPRVPGASDTPRVPGASAAPRVPGAPVASATSRVPSAPVASATTPRVPIASATSRVPGAPVISATPRVPGAPVASATSPHVPGAPVASATSRVPGTPVASDTPPRVPIASATSRVPGAPVASAAPRVPSTPATPHVPGAPVASATPRVPSAPVASADTTPRVSGPLGGGHAPEHIYGKKDAGVASSRSNSTAEAEAAARERKRAIQAPTLAEAKREVVAPLTPSERRAKENTLAKLRAEHQAAEEAKAAKQAAEIERWNDWYQRVFRVQPMLVALGGVLALGLVLCLVFHAAIGRQIRALYQPPFYVAATGEARQKTRSGDWEPLTLDAQPAVSAPVLSKNSIRTVFMARNGGSVRMDKNSSLSVIAISTGDDDSASIGIDVHNGRVFLYSTPQSVIRVKTALCHIEPDNAKETIYEVAANPQKAGQTVLRVHRGTAEIMLLEGKNSIGRARAGEKIVVTRGNIAPPVPLAELDAWEKWNMAWQKLEVMPRIESFLSKESKAKKGKPSGKKAATTQNNKADSGKKKK